MFATSYIGMSHLPQKRCRSRFGLGGGKHRKDRQKIFAKDQMDTSDVVDIPTENIDTHFGLTPGAVDEAPVSVFNPNIKYKVDTTSAPDESIKLKFVQKSQGDTDGSRIINLSNLSAYVSDISKHSLLCPQFSKLPETPIKLLGEIDRHGLHSVIAAECQGCFRVFKLHSSPKLPVKDSFKYDVNVRAVWGEMVTGGGVSHLNESLATIGVPGMTQTTLTNIEQDIYDWWCVVLDEELEAAAAEEKRLAIARGDFHGGVPAITVVCDGGWSKRSHKHSYNAAGGVAIIIGQATGKLLHIGICNKNCYIRTAAESKHVKPMEHTCYKNWTDSSQAMEADIIYKGFVKANTFGLRYIRMIGDGDSSAYSKIVKNLPDWGKYVVKIECANYCVKCLRGSLEKLVAQKSHYKGAKMLSRQQRVRLVTAVRSAIRMRSKEAVDSNRVPKLRHDIMNSVHHIFGNHDNCSSEYCKVAQGQSSQNSEPVTQTDRSGQHLVEPLINQGDSPSVEPDSPEETFNDQHQYWTEGSTEADMELVRGQSPVGKVVIDAQMLADINILLQRVASKADRLIDNFTSNLAEAWMNIRTKFDGGKQYNRCNRGSWHARCYGGALRMNIGVEWSPKVWQTVTKSHPTKPFLNHYRQRALKHKSSMKSQNQPEVKARARKRKSKSLSVSISKKARQSYGPESVQVSEDVSDVVLAQLNKNYQRLYMGKMGQLASSYDVS